jgi:hypothetical protein
MSPRAAAWLAWSVCAFSLVLTVVGLLLLSLNLSHPNVHVYDYWHQSAATGVAFSTLGALVASRRPEHPRRVALLRNWLPCRGRPLLR